LSTEDGGGGRFERVYEALLRARAAAPLIVVAVAVALAAWVMYSWPGSASAVLTAPPAPYRQVLSSGQVFAFGKGVYEVVVRSYGPALNVSVACGYCGGGKPVRLHGVTGVAAVRIRCLGEVVVRVRAVIPPFHRRVAEVVVRRVAP